MTKETKTQLLAIVSIAIEDQNTKQLKWLADFFKRQYENSLYFDNVINNYKK